MPKCTYCVPFSSLDPVMVSLNSVLMVYLSSAVLITSFMSAILLNTAGIHRLITETHRHT